jgi:hypothetical protein
MKPGSKVQRRWSRAAKRPLAVRLRARKNWQSLAKRRVFAGLTTRGTVATRVPELTSLVADLDALAVNLSSIYDLVPAETQRRCTLLGQTLARIRNRLA